jgi:diphthine-ammonia ligase
MNSDNTTKKKNAIASWTGGKDGCHSCYKTMNDGYNITHRLYFTNQKKTGSHELNPALIRAQAQVFGLPPMQRIFRSCEQDSKKSIRELPGEFHT